jgi:hypothetical protein
MTLESESCFIAQLARADELLTGHVVSTRELLDPKITDRIELAKRQFPGSSAGDDCDVLRTVALLDQLA